MCGRSAFCVFAILVNSVLAGRHDKYSGYSVHGVELRNVADQRILHNLEYEFNLDIWQYGAPALRDSLVMVTPENRLTFLDRLDSNQITHYLHTADVAKRLEEHDVAINSWKRHRSNKMAPFEDYPTYEEVDAYLERVAAEYPSLVTLVNAGPSFEGRAIKYLKVAVLGAIKKQVNSFLYGNVIMLPLRFMGPKGIARRPIYSLPAISTTNFTDTSKPIYFMDATMHAREWVTTPVTLYSIHRLVEDLRDGDTDLLTDTDWIVLPIVNPDGYVYTHTDERLWRRTRSYNPSVSTTCYGVDANRNFNISFNTVGVSSDPCSNIYPGPEAFSEVEARYVRDILHEYQDRIQLYLNIHSQGNYVLFGYGDNILPDNAVHLHYVGAIMGAAIDTMKLPEALYYMVGNSGLVLYATSGSAQDYGQATGIPFSYTLELPGYGYGHDVPPEFIEQINTETWAGIAASARVAAIYYRSRPN